MHLCQLILFRGGFCGWLRCGGLGDRRSCWLWLGPVVLSCFATGRWLLRSRLLLLLLFGGLRQFLRFRLLLLLLLRLLGNSALGRPLPLCLALPLAVHVI
jgi:hypothetical protein